MPIWNPWHGCHKISPGCQHCYVYRRDSSVGKDSRLIMKTANFDLPIQRNRKREYKLQPETEPVYTCMTSDFFLEEADVWRPEVWRMIKARPDLTFAIITKRIDRFFECIPEDWGVGYENVRILCTCENQSMADYRLPLFLAVPIRYKSIIHEPMLEEIHIEKYLRSGQIRQVICGGESGDDARLCDYAWVLSTREQCIQENVSFTFKQTGALFKKGDRIYRIERKLQMSQARKAGINFLSQCEDPEDLFVRLSKSKFRSSFHLKLTDRDYVKQKGSDSIRQHADDFVRQRLAPAYIPNNGKQTPMRGHPVFLAQHATGTCCRNCLQKWHHIPPGTELTKEQQKYVVDVIMEWINRQMYK